MGIGGKGKGSKEKTKDGEETTPEEEKQQQEFIEKYGEGMVGAISVFHGMKYSQIKDLLVQEDGKMKIKDTAYDELVLRFGEDNPNVKERNPAGLSFLKKIKKNDDNNLVDLSLNAM